MPSTHHLGGLFRGFVNVDFDDLTLHHLGGEFLQPGPICLRQGPAPFSPEIHQRPGTRILTSASNVASVDCDGAHFCCSCTGLVKKWETYVAHASRQGSRTTRDRAFVISALGGSSSRSK